MARKSSEVKIPYVDNRWDERDRLERKRISDQRKQIIIDIIYTLAVVGGAIVAAGTILFLMIR